MTAVDVRPTLRPAPDKPALSAILREIHGPWIREVRQHLEPAMAADASFWDGWGVTRYLGDRFDRQYWRKNALVAAMLPLLRPRDAALLQADGETLEEVRRNLIGLGRRQGVTATVATTSRQFLELLRNWLAQIERLASGLTREDLPHPGRRALARLETAASLLR